MRQPQVEQMILEYIFAMGPVGVNSIREYLRGQCVEPVMMVDIAEVLTVLIRKGSVDIYDDGVTFNAAR